MAVRCTLPAESWNYCTAPGPTTAVVRRGHCKSRGDLWCEFLSMRLPGEGRSLVRSAQVARIAKPRLAASSLSPPALPLSTCLKKYLSRCSASPRLVWYALRVSLAGRWRKREAANQHADSPAGRKKANGRLACLRRPRTPPGPRRNAAGRSALPWERTASQVGRSLAGRPVAGS